MPGLAWIASDTALPEGRHLELIEAGAAWVAVDATDQPVGFLAAEAFAAGLHIWQFAVRHNLQGQGLGRELLETAACWADARAMPALTLTTFRAVPWNEPFYQRCGFRTLEAEDLSDTLRRILEEEIKAGLPADQRCAMVRRLR